MLAIKHPHARDEFISFEEEGHLYTIKGLEGHPISVTTLIHQFFPIFDADLVIDKMVQSRNWPRSKYYGMTKDAIKQQWEENRDDASAEGTAMHKAIEVFLNRPEQEQELVNQQFTKTRTLHETVPATIEFFHFLAFWTSQIGETLRPYRTEWLVYDEEKRLAGSIDLVLEDTKTGKVIIVDWKRSKDIKTENRFQKGREFWSHLDDCNWNHYSLQLNMYRHLLETHYGKQVAGMYLAILHPNAPSYQLCEVARMEAEILAVMQQLPLAVEITK
jgi:ATP-dependent exoDNAse (exonuclease V) beta subunit